MCIVEPHLAINRYHVALFFFREVGGGVIPIAERETAHSLNGILLFATILPKLRQFFQVLCTVTCFLQLILYPRKARVLVVA